MVSFAVFLQPYLVKYVGEIDCRIGIDEEIYEHAHDKHEGYWLVDVMDRLPETSNESDNLTHPLIAEDGIYVELGRRWSERMTGNG